MKRLLRNNGLSSAIFGLFLSFLIAESFAGYRPLSSGTGSEPHSALDCPNFFIKV